MSLATASLPASSKTSLSVVSVVGRLMALHCMDMGIDVMKSPTLVQVENVLLWSMTNPSVGVFLHTGPSADIKGRHPGCFDMDKVVQTLDAKAETKEAEAKNTTVLERVVCVRCKKISWDEMNRQGVVDLFPEVPESVPRLVTMIPEEKTTGPSSTLNELEESFQHLGNCIADGFSGNFLLRRQEFGHPRELKKHYFFTFPDKADTQWYLDLFSRLKLETNLAKAAIAYLFGENWFPLDWLKNSSIVNITRELLAKMNCGESVNHLFAPSPAPREIRFLRVAPVERPPFPLWTLETNEALLRDIRIAMGKGASLLPHYAKLKEMMTPPV